jgi:prolyl oligopeptidase
VLRHCSLILIFILAACVTENAPPPRQKLTYPQAKLGDTVDVHHGVRVADPYRWLESTDADDTRAWVKAENDVTFAYLAGIPAREPIKARLTEAWNFERYGLPQREGQRYFFTKNTGLQNQSVLFWSQGLESEPKVLLDPNLLSKDGTTALKSFVLSKGGVYMAYGLADAGSDWTTWRVRDVATGKDLADQVRWLKFSEVTWLPDASGFFYSRYPEPKPGRGLDESNFDNKLYFHKLGTPQSADALVYERPDHKEWGFDAEVTHDGRYLVVTVWKGTDDKNMVLWKPLGGNEPLRELVSGFEGGYVLVTSAGPVLTFKTNKDAPRGRLVAVDVSKPGPESWRVVVPEAAETLEGVARVGDKLVAYYLKDARSQLKLFTTSGAFVQEVTLPGLGSISGVSGDESSSEAFYAFESFVQPLSIYRYDVALGEIEIYREPKTKLPLAELETTQVFVKSKDGTQLPMFITKKKGTTYDGKNPTLLYGYGGFNISITPWFSVPHAVWIEMGGVLAVANLRGGGEYGEAWHDAGKLANKQNVFDDFIASAEWLVANRVTTRDRLAITGRSNGGLLVGATIAQRPDLFAAALPAVGVLDMLRFHKFTIGWAWVDDYGSAEDATMFPVLHRYSPLHNVKPGTHYPATMITTADHDDRVVPAHSYKFAAALQAAQAGGRPVLIRIETEAGHGRDKPTTKQIEEVADQWAFLTRELGMGDRVELATRSGN